MEGARTSGSLGPGEVPGSPGMGQGRSGQARRCGSRAEGSGSARAGATLSSGAGVAASPSFAACCVDSRTEDAPWDGASRHADARRPIWTWSFACALTRWATTEMFHRCTPRPQCSVRSHPFSHPQVVVVVVCPSEQLRTSISSLSRTLSQA